MLDFKGVLVLLLTVMSITQSSRAYREISGILDNAADLTHEEINMLVPLFEEMQLQYDLIRGQLQQGSTEIDELFKNSYTATVKEFHKHFAFLMQEEPISNYETSLPTAKEIMGKRSDFNKMTPEQHAAYLDMQSFLQDTLDEAQYNLDAFVTRSLQVESDLLKLNKPKIVMNILKALSALFNASARVGRAAYCTYSNVPQLNASLHHIYDGVDCYLLATAMVVKIQNETFQTVKIVRKSVSDLAAVYKRIVAKQSIAGQIVALMKNTLNILRSILKTLRQANRVIDEVVHQLPGATLQVVNCGITFRDRIPYVVRSVANTTTCIMYVDDEKRDYDWMEPENSTRIPEIIPDPESGELDGSFEMP